MFSKSLPSIFLLQLYSFQLCHGANCTPDKGQASLVDQRRGLELTQEMLEYLQPYARNSRSIVRNLRTILNQDHVALPKTAKALLNLLARVRLREANGTIAPHNLRMSSEQLELQEIQVWVNCDHASSEGNVHNTLLYDFRPSWMRL
jgi:hypothetical protein